MSARVPLGTRLVRPLILALLACTPSGDAVVPSDVDTGPFDGEYALNEAASFQDMRRRLREASDSQARNNLNRVIGFLVQRYANFRIKHGVIRSGTILVQEFSLIDATISGDTLRGRAVWHEDVHDPGDMSEEPIMLVLRGDELRFVLGDSEEEINDPVVLTRVARPDE